jgi:hypothetical protein
VGQSYTLTFDYGNNKGSNGIEQLTFGFGDQNWVIDIGGAIPSFITVTYTFVFNGSTDHLFFADTGTVSPNDNGGPIIDNISISAVPVPATGFLLLGALGGLMAPRRRKTA